MTAKRTLVVVGTRPEAIKLFPVIRALRAQPRLETMVCVTGQHRDLVDPVLGLAGIRPDFDLGLMMPGETLDAMTGRLLSGIGTLLDAERPDRIIVQGDTASAKCGTLAAYYRRIPIAHVEAGLRSGNLHHPWPEEGNRRIIGTLADVHFAPTERAATALRSEGIELSRIHMTGNSGIDALLHMRDLLRSGQVRAPVVADLATRFAARRIVAVTCHRRENMSALTAIADALARLARREDVAIILPLHPNPDIAATFRPALAALANVALTPPLDYPDFVALLDACHLVLTDSGGVQEEAPALGKPVLVMRETTERPEGVSAGTARLVGTDPAHIVSEVARLLDDPGAHAVMARAHSPYGDGRAADRIAAVLAQEPR
ncbi:MAG TPA: UDP-N-acetylglucosamine 2-epimerase (non-hydrolyzing) [Sphingobium sp.]